LHKTVNSPEDDNAATEKEFWKGWSSKIIQRSTARDGARADALTLFP